MMRKARWKQAGKTMSSPQPRRRAKQLCLCLPHVRLPARSPQMRVALPPPSLRKALRGRWVNLRWRRRRQPRRLERWDVLMVLQSEGRVSMEPAPSPRRGGRSRRRHHLDLPRLVRPILRPRWSMQQSLTALQKVPMVATPLPPVSETVAISRLQPMRLQRQWTRTNTRQPRQGCGWTRSRGQESGACYERARRACHCPTDNVGVVNRNFKPRWLKLHGWRMNAEHVE
mmetsp:Transcript_15787/g.40829  ORF Transcript_15787/g.40829 Transcript_15787/m.40829 type:complete len:228 (+) Transcript_15787:434-1117(+)